MDKATRMNPPPNGATKGTLGRKMAELEDMSSTAETRLAWGITADRAFHSHLDARNVSDDARQEAWALRRAAEFLNAAAFSVGNEDLETDPRSYAADLDAAERLLRYAGRIRSELGASKDREAGKRD